MRLIAFMRTDGAPALGIVDGGQVIDLSAADPGIGRDLAAFLRGGSASFERARRAVEQTPRDGRLDPAGLQFRPLVDSAGKYICLGLNYAAHAAEGGQGRPEYPAFFLRARTSLVAHGQPIVCPRVSAMLDYEAELAVVIGRRGRHVSEHDALGLVAGYACFNDASIRDYQRRSPQWTIGKNFDSTGAFGPALVTADELPPGGAGLRIVSRLNGEVMQDANTADMIFGVARTIALLSECCTLEPGDVISMGTPSGVGFARKPPVWMRPGDLIEVEIEGIGILRNPVIAEPD
jgi:2-keto-4-pentenoate hydratase/2-oxohepta-3-ene-1,7-dioic acid hydratase in catechol pathway